jgi:hypothetical protein
MDVMYQLQNRLEYVHQAIEYSALGQSQASTTPESTETHCFP